MTKKNSNDITNEIGSVHKFPSEQNRILTFDSIYNVFVWNTKQNRWKMVSRPFTSLQGLKSYCKRAIQFAKKSKVHNVGIQITKTTLSHHNPLATPQTKLYYRGRIVDLDIKEEDF